MQCRRPAASLQGGGVAKAKMTSLSWTGFTSPGCQRKDTAYGKGRGRRKGRERNDEVHWSDLPVIESCRGWDTRLASLVPRPSPHAS